jgi:DNA-binding transcriptional ArsR family regulator
MEKSGKMDKAEKKEKIEKLANMLKACGHPLRLKILYAIEREEEPCVSELWTCLEQAQPVVSQHLAVLKRKGIVRAQVQGNRRVYTIVNPFIKSMIHGLLVDSAASVEEPSSPAR